jgi:drug/metabolite transporter (DMT)-like permease
LKPWHLISLLVMNCLWAASYSVFKALSPALDAGNLTTLRFGLAALVLLACWRLFPGESPRGRDLARTMLMGILVFTIAPRLQVRGVQLGQATDASVLMALEPLIASLAAAIFLREHIGPRRCVGFALGMAGVVAMNEVWRPDFHLPGLAANALILLSFAVETCYSVMGKPLLGRANLFKILTIALLSGTSCNLALNGDAATRAAAAMSLESWLLLAYLTIICTVVGFALWFTVIQQTDISVASLTVFLQPVSGVLIAMVWLGESLRWGQLWGSLVIVAGLVIGLSRQLRPSAVARK